MNTFNLRLDVDKAAKGMRNQVVRIRKGDLNGTILVATLYDHGTKITTSGLTVDFVMLQPDREHYYRATATWSAANGTASVTLDESYAGSVAGDTDVAYFELRQGTQVIASTENFRISVLRSATDEGETPAESYDDIIPAAVYAWLEDHPEATTTVQDDSLTTAKYKDHSVTRAKLAADAIGNRLRGTGTGIVVTTSDAYAAPPLGLTVNGKSVQDGTPTPSAPVAIDSVDSVTAGFSGKNLAEFFSHALNDSAYWFASGSLSAAGTQLADGWCSLTINGSNLNVSPKKAYLPAVKAGETYTVMVEVKDCTLSSAVPLHLYVATDSMWATAVDVSITGNGTFYATSNIVSNVESSAVTHLRTFIDTRNKTFSGKVRISLYKGSYSGQYAPYSAQTVPIDLQGHELRSLPDGTRDELLVDADGNVTLVQRVNSVTFNGTENWVKAASAPYNFRIPQVNGFSDIALAGGDTNPNGLTLWCNRFVFEGSYSADKSKYGVTIGGNTQFFFDWRNVGTDMTLNDWKAWVAANELTVCYPKGEPVTIPLGTVTLPALAAPDATAWATTTPSTTVTLDYERDVNMAVEELGSNIAPVEQAVATANHATGSLMMLGGHLVKATTAIAIGEAVTIGTNVAATTVAAELALKANA